MVSTRRSTAKANGVPADTQERKDTEPPSDTIKNKKRPKKVKLTLNIPKSPVILPVSVFSGNTGDHDTSPAADGVSKAPNTKTPGTKSPPAGLFDRTTSGSQRSVPKPLSGSCQDPIVVNENSSPPRPTVRLPKRKHADERTAEPHEFTSQGYRDSYNYGASRSALARRPPKRNTHNSHQSHDIYKAMNERRAIDTYHNHNAFRGSVAHAFPFQAQYPLPGQTLAYQQVQPSILPPYAQYIQYPAPPVQHYTITSQSEDMLRREAKRYIQEFSRTSPHKQTLSITDPREKKSGEVEQHNSRHGFFKDGPRESLIINPFSNSQIDRYPRSEPTVSQGLQSNLCLNSIIKHTSLLTSLLQIYPYSSDQKGLLEDIRAMASIQNLNMTAWLDSTSQVSSKRSERSSDNTIDAGTQPSSIGNLQAAAPNDNDTELRQVFAATAPIWQDGTGHGVADVFRTRPSSPSTPSAVTSPTQPTLNSVERNEETEKAVTVAVTAIPTTRVQRAGTEPARTTISPTPPTPYSPIVKISDSVPRD